MSEIFISYARSTATQARAVAEALRGLGYGVWRDDELPTRGVNRLVPNSGHYIQIEQPQVVIEAIDEVLRESRGPR